MAEECDCCSSTDPYCEFVTRKGIYTCCEQHYLPMKELCSGFIILDREFKDRY